MIGASVVVLMACVSISGTANSFAGNIRAAAFGSDHDFIVVVFDSIIYFLFNLIAVCIVAWRGGIPQADIRFLFRRGQSWGELGMGCVQPW